MTAIASGSSIALISVEDLDIGRAIAFNDEASGVETLFSVNVVQRDGKNIEATFSCSSSPVQEAGRPLILNARGMVKVALGDPSDDQLPSIEKDDWNIVPIEVDRFYEQFARLEYDYSPPFRGMRSIKRRSGYATGTIENEAGSAWEDQLLVHPGMLDTSLQASSAAFSCPGDGRMWGLYNICSIGLRSGL
ncbi:polyketide synthase dehydratase-domain-containing protein [Achaetomium macrosporum]|uniref:Polyketide synthase dehydratase-domain-containing protein n=1 Tax=Achaetomium macrosporum TaxID=79813 RepID=A0AAN7C036_9PEZI|nr:polyketide synthase dehydratase-domain-containing protein [Achaetomium macrosporum]